jgi:hypothetical protein
MSSSERAGPPSSGASDLLSFFHALPAAARAEYQELAAADRSFGEDVVAERRARKAERA